jgi:SagB-type dehydrogenase family enzyme
MLRKLVALAMIFNLAGGVAMSATKTIKLPEPRILGKMSVEEAIFRRRSERSFYPNELSLEQVSQLLWSAQGITDKSWGFRAAPSAGSLYPLYLYILKKDGVFQYIPDGHKLKQISEEDKRPSLVRASLGQGYISEAPLVIVICGNFRITEAKYGQRSYRYVNMEVGHVAENIHLQAVAMGMASVPIGAFWDDVVAKVLELPETQDPFYIVPVGYLKSSS